MKVLVTTSQSLLLVDTESGEYRPINRGHGLYYGMAVHDGQLYVAARNGLGRYGGEILVFNADWSMRRTILMPFATDHLHEIAWHDGVLLVTASSENLIGIFDGRRWDEWHPLGRHDRDVFHFNSFMCEPGCVWILAHNHGSSFILECSYPEKEIVSRLTLGTKAHNIRRAEGQIVVCSSEDSMLLGSRGFRLGTGMWPRGLIASGAERCVGLSEMSERAARGWTPARLQVYDGQWKLQRTIVMPNEGGVYDVLQLPPGFTASRTQGQAQSLAAARQ